MRMRRRVTPIRQAYDEFGAPATHLIQLVDGSFSSVWLATIGPQQAKRFLDRAYPRGGGFRPPRGWAGATAEKINGVWMWRRAV